MDRHTVDGRTPAPVEVGSLYLIIYRFFLYIPGDWPDFFHQHAWFWWLPWEHHAESIESRTGVSTGYYSVSFSTYETFQEKSFSTDMPTTVNHQPQPLINQWSHWQIILLLKTNWNTFCNFIKFQHIKQLLNPIQAIFRPLNGWTLKKITWTQEDLCAKAIALQVWFPGSTTTRAVWPWEDA